MKLQSALPLYYTILHYTLLLFSTLLTSDVESAQRGNRDQHPRRHHPLHHSAHSVAHSHRLQLAAQATSSAPIDAVRPYLELLFSHSGLVDGRVRGQGEATDDDRQQQ